MAPAASALAIVSAVALAAADVPAPRSLRGAPNASEAAVLASGAQCSWEDGKNSHGTNLKQAPWSNAPQDCCDHCSETQGCVAWTFIKGSHECWLKSSVPDKGQWQGDGSAVSGMGGGHSPGAKCSWEDGKNSDGTNLKQAPWSEAPQDCCNHCGETQGCVAWTFIKGSHECWLKSQVPSRAQWRGDGSAVSGTIGAPGALSQPASNLSAPGLGKANKQCVQLTGTYCAGQKQGCDCNWCDDFCQDTHCARTCRVMNGHFSSPAGFSCSWKAASIGQAHNDADGKSCHWMEGNGQYGHGDDCKQCDPNAMKCRRANPNGNCNV